MFTDWELEQIHNLVRQARNVCDDWQNYLIDSQHRKGKEDIARLILITEEVEAILENRAQ